MVSIYKFGTIIKRTVIPLLGFDLPVIDPGEVLQQSLFRIQLTVFADEVGKQEQHTGQYDPEVFIIKAEVCQATRYEDQRNPDPGYGGYPFFHFSALTFKSIFSPGVEGDKIT
jgi:hypothetical protein